MVFGWLAIDQKFRAARIRSGDFRAGAVAFFADDEKKSEIGSSGIEKSFRGGNHRADDAFGVAGATTPDKFGVFD